MQLLDEEEVREIRRILEVLPADHRARAALDRPSSAEQIMYVLISQPLLREEVRRAHARHAGRIPGKTPGASR